MNTYKALSGLILLLVGLGCASNAPRDCVPDAQSYHLHLPGIGGDTFVHHWWCDELDSAIPGMTSEVYDWTGHRFPISVLQAYERNRAEATLISQRIQSRHREHPNERIILTAESGGTGPLVWALEDLPVDVMVDDVILISSALSTSYDLSAALRHVRGSMHVFNSEHDDIICDWGTKTYGTIDGPREQAAGRFGFVAPETADGSQYRKLVQIPYHNSWWKYLNFGGHGQGMSPSFAKNVIGPLLADGALRG